MEQDKKVKALIAHILEECEKEGLTIAEVSQVPQQLRFAIEGCVSRIHKETKITVFQVGQ